MKRVMLNDSTNKCKIGLGRDIAIMKLNQHFRHLDKEKLFRYFKNSMDINQYTINQNKSALDGLFSFYPSLMKLLVDTKNKMKK